MLAEARCRLACTCVAARRVYSGCRWSYLVCSMFRLMRRHRFSDVPHWTVDMMAMCTLLRQPVFGRLRSLCILLDDPCFEAEHSRCIQHEYAGRPRVVHTSVETLDVRVVRRHYAKPSPHAMNRVVELFPNLKSLTLYGIKNVGMDVLRCLLRHDRLLWHMAFQQCSFTSSARTALVHRLSMNDDPSVLPANDSRMHWPAQLASFEMTGPSARSILRSVSHAIDDKPMQLPLSLCRLDMHDAIDALHDVQILLTLVLLQGLTEFVVSAHTRRTLGLLNFYQAQLFPHVTMQMFV